MIDYPFFADYEHENKSTLINEVYDCVSTKLSLG